MSTTVADAEPSSVINDRKFWDDLWTLKRLREFLLLEGVTVQNPDAVAFGWLNMLRFDSRKGRPPTPKEWNWLENHRYALFSSLTPAMRRKFQIGILPDYVVAVVPILSAIFAVGALIGAVHAEATKSSMVVLACYLFWLVALGAIGAMAFLGMNALAIQSDVTFDLTNRRLLTLRVVLGGLFGLVFSLPLGIDSFHTFLSGVTSVAGSGGTPTDKVNASAILPLIAPFVLGFSTTLVITVMNRLIDGVQAFFGRAPAAVPAGSTGGDTGSGGAGSTNPPPAGSAPAAGVHFAPQGPNG